MTVQNPVTPPHLSASIHDPLSRVRSHSVSTTYLRQGTAGTQYCDYCDKKLTSKSSLILHIRTADNTDIDDKYLFLIVFHQFYLKTLYMLDGRQNLNYDINIPKYSSSYGKNKTAFTCQFLVTIITVLSANSSLSEVGS